MDAVAPRSAASPRIPSHPCQTGGAGCTVSGEEDLNERCIFVKFIFFTKNDNNLYEKVPLEAVPYSEEYGEHLETASEYLKEVITYPFVFI